MLQDRKEVVFALRSQVNQVKTVGNPNCGLKNEVVPDDRLCYEWYFYGPQAM